MGLWDTAKAIGRGESFSTAMGYAFVSGGEIARGRELDSALTEENRRDFESGRWNESTYSLASTNASRGSTEEIFRNPDSNPWEGFKAGAAEGLAGMQNAVKTTASGILGGALGFIPWWIWLGGIAYLVWRLGLLGKVLKK
jgi:hypothetical protein